MTKMIEPGAVFDRRRLVVSAAGFALASATPVHARQDATPEPATANGAWTFVDDMGVTITLPQRPQRVVAYLPLATALWDFGVQSVAYYGIGLRPDGTRETIARVESLAADLGGDLDAPRPIADKAAFTAAVAELQAAIGEKPGLTVAFVSGLPEESFWVGNPMKLGDLRFFQELGLDIVQPENQVAFSEELSWEQAGKYPADLFFIDDRQWSATGEELVAQVPTFAILPAAQVGAFASWPSEYVPSYAGMTPVLESLTAAIRNADPDIV